MNVPHPAGYAWQKCIVAERRRMPAKVGKDLLQAEALFDVLATERPADVADMFDDLSGPRRDRSQQIASNGLTKIDASSRDRVLAVIRKPA